MALPPQRTIIACPHCGFLAIHYRMISRSSFGAVMWSDGKVQSRSWGSPWLTKCNSCKRFYWVEEAKLVYASGILGNPSKGKKPKRDDDIPFISDLSVEEYDEALEVLREGIATDREKERYICLLIWWKLNDPLRNDPTSNIPDKHLSIFRKTLRRLYSILDNKDPREKIMKAEILRELGDFSGAVKELRGIPREYKWISRIIIDLCSKGNSRVTKLNYPTNHT